ncbi:MAG: zf-HC2 domain-containing protein [Planctomycetes bacterium]|nr:zf-HC2 domain-containing protein [Planctomycetota bacterium]
MNCSDAERLFDAYVDNELSGSLRLEFDAHRLRCTLCQRKLALIDACRHILAADDRGPVLSENFTDRLMAQVSQGGIRRRRRWSRSLTVTSAFALQAAAVIAFFMLWPRLHADKSAVGGGVSISNISPKDSPGIGDMVSGGVRDVWRVRRLIAEDFGALPRYAMRFAVAGETAESGGIFSSLNWLLGGDDSADDDAAGAADATDTFSL